MIIDSHAHYNHGVFRKPFRYLDYGQEGYQDTKDALDAVNIGYAGRDEYAIYETESGLRVGVYALSFGTTAQVKAGMEALKAPEPDFIIAAMHWGDEGSYTVNADQITLAHACIDEGADFVYGSHPHTLQPYEVYKGKYIYYSMGNWTFGGNTDPRDNDTFILRLTLEKTPDGEVSVAPALKMAMTTAPFSTKRAARNISAFSASWTALSPDRTSPSVTAIPTTNNDINEIRI